ncbi:hypothetical protein L484_001744 [Morus notabilis]|uniref:Uncharacterized protein n=1 Tax=Morus notabilis TaxID=981085 RepID=W9QE68_9ROSA|nr:hypothetical protein L484_001744 [Morus notabilis]
MKIAVTAGVVLLLTVVPLFKVVLLLTARPPPLVTAHVVPLLTAVDTPEEQSVDMVRHGRFDEEVLRRIGTRRRVTRASYRASSAHPCSIIADEHRTHARR